MDCDNQEIEATKNMKEKTADEMFEELGYEKTQVDNLIKYNRLISNLHYNEYYYIEFSLKFKTIYIDNPWGNKIDMQELQAINKKCIELGWI